MRANSIKSELDQVRFIVDDIIDHMPKEKENLETVNGLINLLKRIRNVYLILESDNA